MSDKNPSRCSSSDKDSSRKRRVSSKHVEQKLTGVHRDASQLKSVHHTASDDASSLPDSSAASTSALTSTSHRVVKMTPAVALCSLRGSIDTMTSVIESTASKPIESITSEDRAVARRQSAVRLVQDREDGLSNEDKAKLLKLFFKHPNLGDVYIELTDNDLRRLMIQDWLAQ